MDADLTHDDFLGGAVTLWQPRKGYRAGVDAVLLAAAVPALAGQSVLELGCGVGTASLCLKARVEGVRITGVEVLPDYAALAQRNGTDFEVINADLRALPAELRQRQFDHVIMNPPYFDRTQGAKAADQGRDTGRAGDTPLADWVDVGIKRIAPKGHFTLIQHITRLPEVLNATQGRIGSIVVRPIIPRDGRPANLFLLQGQQAGKAPFSLAPPLIMHAGDRHERDEINYTQEVSDILRKPTFLELRD